jgi:hypothetical protein
MDLISIVGVGAFALAIDILVTEYDQEKQVLQEGGSVQTPLNIQDGIKKEENPLSDHFVSAVVESIILKHGERAFDIPKYKDYSYSEIDNKAYDDTYVDLNREFKSLATDVVIGSYVKTKENLFRFMKLVVEMMEKSLDIYAEKRGINRSDLIFAYKGGNVMRILANEFLVELPGMASREINSYYQNYFKRSDADFTIYINPKLENFETVFEELTFLSYLIQFIIRHEFMSNSSFYFEYDKYNEETKQTILNEFLNNLNKAGSLADKANPDYFEGRFLSVTHRGYTIDNDGNFSKISSDADEPKDSFIQFSKETEKNDKKVVTFSISDAKHYMFLQDNTALKFQDDTGSRYFNLVRTKINFNANLKSKEGTEIKKAYGGELIDVTIPHKSSFGIESFWEKIKKYIKKYTLTYEKDAVAFNTYSLEYIIEDLEDVLFRQSHVPWDDKKYMKRVNRLFYFYFLDMFAKLPSNMERIHFVLGLSKMLTKIENNNIQPNKIKMLYDEMDGYDIHLKNLVVQTIRLLNESKKLNQQEKFTEFVQILIENCKVINNGFKHAEQFCKIQSQIKEKKEVVTDISSLEGGSKKK